MPLAQDVREQEQDFYDAPLIARRPLQTGPRGRHIAVIAAVLALVLVAGGAFVLTQSGRSTEVALDDVVERFRSERTQRAAATPATGADETAPATTPARAADEPVQAAVTTPATEAGAVAAAEAQAAAPPEPYSPPDEGVYTFRASGSERISMLNGHHTYPDRVYATVEHLDGCRWTGTFHVLAEHTDEVTLCSEPGRFLQASQLRTVSFFGVTESQPFWCDPPQVLHATSEAPGTTDTTRCRGEGNNTTDITRTFVGVEPMTIAGQQVDTIHVHIESAFRGTSTGTSIDDLWLSTQTALPYRWKREIDTMSDSALGRVHYTEQADFVIESLEPADG